MNQKVKDTLETINNFADTIGNNAQRTTIKHLAKQVLAQLDAEKPSNDKEMAKIEDLICESIIHHLSFTCKEKGIAYGKEKLKQYAESYYAKRCAECDKICFKFKDDIDECDKSSTPDAETP